MIKNFLLLMCMLFLVACETTPKNPEAWAEREINACLPTAIMFKQSLRKYDVWADVFTYQWYDSATRKNQGHAMVAYLYPPGANKLWTYDSWGSYRTYALTNSVMQIAQQAHQVRGYKDKVFLTQWIK